MEPVTTLPQMLRLRISDMKNAAGCRTEWIRLMEEAADELDRLYDKYENYNDVLGKIREAKKCSA